MRALPLVLALLLLAPAATAAPPQAGLLVPGESLGGIRLGMTPAQVKAAWGARFGRCRSCTQQTWYFTYRAFSPQGAAVEFRNGRVAAILTLWSPRGWRTSRGLRVGDGAERITALYPGLRRTECGSYRAHVLRRGRVASVFYEAGGRVWGFGLLGRAAQPCR
jgi:hypothetical protein